jgi:Fe-S cluster biogenesis protein NfuA/nitrite reductase/ring-hydroxylating ferredoxin subunit
VEAQGSDRVVGDLRPELLLERVRDLTERVDELSDARARTLAQELVAAVIAMYGDGLRRIIDVISDSREAGATIIDELSQDGAVASLLLIHDLYPVSLEERVVEALDTVRPYMESHGGNVELIGVEDGVAKLVLKGSCNGCAASRATLELAIKQALDEHAPDLIDLEVQGVTEPDSLGGVSLPMAAEPPARPAFELPVVHSGPEPPVSLPDRSSHWVSVAHSSEPVPGAIRALDVDGAALVLANVDGTLLAYVDECASCGEPLGDGGLDGGMLRCATCGCEFDLPRAGRAAGNEPLQLRPVPLLEAGGLRVAV